MVLAPATEQSAAGAPHFPLVFWLFPSHRPMSARAPETIGGLAVVRSVAALRRAVAAWRAAGDESRSFRPWARSMRAIWRSPRAPARLCPRVVASLFVNPAQFGPAEDFSRYPRDEAADAAKLVGARCDLLYAPAIDEMYPAGFRHPDRSRPDRRAPVRPVPAGPFRRRRHGRRQAAAPGAARCRLLRREGLPAAPDHPPPRPRPRHHGADRGRADGARGRRARAFLAQCLSLAARARGRAGASAHPRRGRSDAS